MTIQTQIAAYDHDKADAFAERFSGALNDAALVVMTSLGHRAGLLDGLAVNPGLTSVALAERIGVSERYLREWLGVMVTSGVVDYDPVSKSYTLPPEHGAFLTRAASPDNMAVTTQFISLAATIEDKLLERFGSGEGLCYHDFDRFHAVMAEDSAQLVVANLESAILPIVPGLIEILDQGIEVADFGCGAGRAMLRLARAFPNSRFHGFDLCEDAFAGTAAEAAADGLANLRFHAIDLSSAASVGAFDLVTAFDAVHDQADPKGFLRLVRRSLKPGGVFLMQDIGGSRDLEKNIGHPFAPLLFMISSMHCMPVSLGQGGPGLGAMWGVETAQDYLAETGFASVETHRLPHDQLNAYFVARL